MASSSEQAARLELMMKHAGDPSSAFYQGLMAVLRGCEAADRRAKQMAKYITVPFVIPQRDVVALEEQFGVTIKTRGVANRAALTPRVSAMVHCLDSMLMEMAGGGGRQMCLVDGDLMTVAVVGPECKVIERTWASPRLAYGYHAQNAALLSFAQGKESLLMANSDKLAKEVIAGGGEHYWPRVRDEPADVDVVVFNHFRTPCGPGQAAWLGHRKGATVLGCFPFQLDMMHADSGELTCFPGRFYVDRDNDLITLVPAEDATMSISHPYSSLVEFVQYNSVTVGGKEFLCEKFLTIRGILFYTLKPVGEEFEGLEYLRTSLYDAEAARTTVITYPKAKLSREGVLVGWERCKVRMLTTRFEQVMARCRASTNAIVEPAEVFAAFVDYNNVVVNSLDTAVRAERMDYADEHDAALAVALHINYLRHQARGTLNVLLGAMRQRFSMNERSIAGFAMVALGLWWNRPTVGPVVTQGELPVQKVVDWCGNDFGVTVADENCWIDVETLAGEAREYTGRMFAHLPRPPAARGSGWYQSILEVARSLCPPPVASRGIGYVVARPRPVVGVSGEKAERCVAVAETAVLVHDVKPALTQVKERLVAKLAADQHAQLNPAVVREFHRREVVNKVDKTWAPVPDVDPLSAISADMDVIRRGLPERDVTQTGYRIAEVDICTNLYGSVAVNDNRRDIPKQRMIRRAKVDVGVEGIRPTSWAALFGALKKRNLGIPANRGNVDLDTFPHLTVDRFIDVCFRDDWQDILARHLDNGLWEFNLPDIEQYMESLDEKKARSLLDTFFSEGTVDLSRWLLMAKGKVKSAREAGAEYTVDHSQTIMYLEDGGTNAAYSAMTKRFKKCLDECLRENVQINSQLNVQDHEEWYNSLETDRLSRVSTTSYSIDARSYDRSQDHVGLRSELCFYKRMGLSEERLRIWSETHGVKKAVSLMFRLVLWMVQGGVSGLWKTLLRNGLIMAFAVVTSTAVTRRNLVCLDVKGDDVDMEVDGVLDVDRSVDLMCMAFNLSAKFFTSDVRYFCKMFRIRKWGRWWFVADPLARVQSLLAPAVVGHQRDTLTERWDSVKPELLHYDNGILVDEVALAAQQYYGLAVAPYGIARSLARFAVDKRAYVGFFLAPEVSS